MMAHSISNSQKLQEEKNAKPEILVLKTSPNAESAEVSDTGLTSSNFMIYCF